MTVFYRKYRPQKFADLVGQEDVVENLLAQLESGKISHGYLFSGPRGTGKTSTARIFAKAVNCKSYQRLETRDQKKKYGEPCCKCVSCVAIADGSAIDLIEIDAASNRGIDEIRDLREKIKLSPLSSRFKVYIIDEAHMLTSEAFNALLKTLEEPPSHAIFILCTTDAAKLPKTIISRLSRFFFKRATDKDIAKALTKIAKEEKVDCKDEVFLEIAKIADGSFRDAVSIFDQLAASGKVINVKNVGAIGGIFTWNQVVGFVDAFSNENLKEAIMLLEKFVEDEGDIQLLIRELVSTFEKLLFIKVGIDPATFVNLDKNQLHRLQSLADEFSFSKLEDIMKLLLVADGEIKLYPMPKIPLLLAVCKICKESGVEGAKAPNVSKEPELENTADNAQEAEVPEVSSSPAFSTKKTKGKIKSMSQIEDAWPKFLEKVRKFNIHLGALLKSARPVEFDGDILTVEVFWQFHKDKLLEPKIYKALEGFLREILDAPIGYQVLLSKKQTRVPKQVVLSDVREISAGQDLSQIAAEIFSK